MEHYIVMSKSFSVDEAGDAKLDAVDVLAVKHNEVEARTFIDNLKKEYVDDEYRVDDDNCQSTDGSILVMPDMEDPGYYIHIYFEIIEN